ncbi:MAG: PD-(D/E)XK nuclease family protein, partial [Ferruginibacter sp.]
MEILSLLNQVALINKKYEDIADITGDRFNIFQILGLSSSEVRLHSALIAELLNPKGSHGLKDTFLALFIEKLFKYDESLKGSFFSSENANVIVEKWIGYVDNENHSGGYIDILIELQNQKSIIIENKINASDQDGQLRRYYNYNKKSIIIYLTLDGKEANELTTKNLEYVKDKISPLCFSYKDFIKEWLEVCKKETVNYPLIRETITQYINLIKHLTHQSTNKLQEMEIEKLILSSKEKYESAEKVSNALQSLRTVSYT